MDEQQEPNEPTIADGRAQWNRPEVDRLVAGGAEGAADISIDGVDIPS